MTRAEALKLAVSKRGWHKNLKFGSNNPSTIRSTARNYKNKIILGERLDPLTEVLILNNAGIVLKTKEEWELKK